MLSGEENLQEAIRLCQAGQKQQAAGVLVSLLKTQPSSEEAWWLLANCVEPAHQKRDCLQRVLRVNPDHPGARLFLSMLDRDQPLPELFAVPDGASPHTAETDGYADTHPLPHPLAPPDPEPDIAALMENARAAEESQQFSTAYKTYESVLELDSSNTLAWLGKGYAAGRLSTQEQNGIPEFFKCFTHAILSRDKRGQTIEEALNCLEPSIARAASERLLKLADFAAEMALSAPQPMANVYAVEHAHIADWAYAISRGREAQPGLWCTRARLTGAATGAFQRLINHASENNLSTRSRQQVFQTLKEYLLSNLSASGMNNDPELKRKLDDIVSRAPRKKRF